MTAGRPKIPIAERVARLTGNAPVGVQPSPFDRANPFDKEADLEAWRLWEYLVPELIERYSVGKGDRHLVEAMCLYYQRALTARSEYSGKMVDSDINGVLRAHPAVKIEDASWDRVDKLAAKLGLNPMARQQLRGAKQADQPTGDRPLSLLDFQRAREQRNPEIHTDDAG